MTSWQDGFRVIFCFVRKYVNGQIQRKPNCNEGRNETIVILVTSRALFEQMGDSLQFWPAIERTWFKEIQHIHTLVSVTFPEVLFRKIKWMLDIETHKNNNNNDDDDDNNNNNNNNMK